MGKKLSPSQWFKSAAASYRSMRATGDMSPSEMRELLADDIQTHHEDGDPFGRNIWIDFIDKYDRDVLKTQRDKADEVAALEMASGLLQQELFAPEVLAKLGLDLDLQLGFGRSVKTLDATHEERLKAIAELERQLDNANKGMVKKLEAIKRADSMAGDKTLREIISDPGEFGQGGAVAQ